MTWNKKISQFISQMERKIKCCLKSSTESLVKSYFDVLQKFLLFIFTPFFFFRMHVSNTGAKRSICISSSLDATSAADSHHLGYRYVHTNRHWHTRTHTSIHTHTHTHTHIHIHIHIHTHTHTNTYTYTLTQTHIDNGHVCTHALTHLQQNVCMRAYTCHRHAQAYTRAQACTHAH